MTPSVTSVVIIICTLLFSAFASGIEIAFISANKFRIELDRKQGKIAARILSKLWKSPSRFIGTMMIGNNISLVVYGLVMAQLLEPGILKFVAEEHHGVIILLQTFISTAIILVAAEFLPKAFFRINPNGILYFFIIPIIIMYYVMYPIVYGTISLAQFILRSVFKIEIIEGKPAFGRIDLDHYIREISTKNNQEEEFATDIQMFQNALDFTKVKVRECMVPRPEIIAISADEPIEKLQLLFIETSLSKILVFKDTVDNIIGFVHSIELFKHPKDIMSILLPVSIVPEVMPANELLTLFIQQHKSIAVVVDEFGGTSGIVTMEDVMEEIFGEIQDEHDTADVIEKKLPGNEFIFSGRIEIDYLNDHYDLNIPRSDAYETLGGFIFHHHEHLPEKGEEIIIPPFIIVIMQVKDRRIELVKLKLNLKEEENS